MIQNPRRPAGVKARPGGFQTGPIPPGSRKGPCRSKRGNAGRCPPLRSTCRLCHYPRARHDPYQFMNGKCGLVSQANPCRCARKAGGFMKNGWLEADNLQFSKNRIAEVRDVAPEPRWTGGAGSPARGAFPAAAIPGRPRSRAAAARDPLAVGIRGELKDFAPTVTVAFPGGRTV